MAERVHLHRRDLAILTTLLERRVETLDYLHPALFPGATRKTAANRLGQLARAGFLTRMPAAHATQDGSHRTVYRLGPRAPAALRLRSITTREPAPPVGHAQIPHQLAINAVADALGTRLEQRRTPADQAGNHEPDGSYVATRPDATGRQIVLVEVDLGHYSRQRILNKTRTFLADPAARSILFITPTTERAALIAGWIREDFGESTMQRVQPLAIAQLAQPASLDAGTEPAVQHRLAASDERHPGGRRALTA